VKQFTQLNWQLVEQLTWPLVDSIRAMLVMISSQSDPTQTTLISTAQIWLLDRSITTRMSSQVLTSHLFRRLKTISKRFSQFPMPAWVFQKLCTMNTPLYWWHTTITSTVIACMVNATSQARTAHNCKIRLEIYSSKSTSTRTVLTFVFHSLCLAQDTRTNQHVTLQWDLRTCSQTQLGVIELFLVGLSSQNSTVISRISTHKKLIRFQQARSLTFMSTKTRCWVLTSAMRSYPLV